MAKSKYLAIILVLINYSTNALASAWLPEKGKYKYSFSFSSINDESRDIKERRADLYLMAQKELYFLSKAIKKIYNKSSALYKKIELRIQYLKKIAKKVEAYQDENSNSYSIEYGINDNISFGTNFLYKKNEFNVSEFNGNKSYVKTFDSFCKFKLFQNNAYILSIQPKFIVNKNQNYPTELFGEISFLAGLSKKKKYANLFSEIGVGVGLCHSNSCDNKKYFSLALSEGMKFPSGFMLVNFTKYYIRKNYGSIYNKTIYEQLSIAKEIKFGNIKQNNLTLQLGYFWDSSLKHSDYQISGTVFSVWLDI